MQYVVKVVIVRVTIYKDEKDTDYYKWKGAEKTEETGIIYIYHMYNIKKIKSYQTYQFSTLFIIFLR
jgi:hypothetical protein